LSWTAENVSGVNYHVWRAPCSAAITNGQCPTASEGAFAIVSGSSGITTSSYTDSSVLGNTNYSYYVTAFCPSGGTCAPNYSIGLDSAPSNHVGTAIPADPLPSPSGLTITTIATDFSSGNEGLMAAWHEAGTTSTTFTLTNTFTGTCLCNGTLESADGNYILQWAGPQQGVTLKVCDSGNNCATAVA
jgi:hypothetical protein